MSQDGDRIAVAALDEEGLLIDGLVLTVAVNDGALRERALHWSKPVVLKQASLRFSGYSNSSVRLGNLYMKHEILGYNNADANDTNFLLADDGETNLTDNAGEFLAPG